MHSKLLQLHPLIRFDMHWLQALHPERHCAMYTSHNIVRHFSRSNINPQLKNPLKHATPTRYDKTSFNPRSGLNALLSIQPKGCDHACHANTHSVNHWLIWRKSNWIKRHLTTSLFDTNPHPPSQFNLASTIPNFIILLFHSDCFKVGIISI